MLALYGVGPHEAHVLDELGVLAYLPGRKQHAAAVHRHLAQVVERHRVAVEDRAKGVVLLPEGAARNHQGHHYHYEFQSFHLCLSLRRLL